MTKTFRIQIWPADEPTERWVEVGSVKATCASDAFSRAGVIESGRYLVTVDGSEGDGGPYMLDCEKGLVAVKSFGAERGQGDVSLRLGPPGDV